MTALQPEDVAGRVLAELDAWEAAAKRVNTGQWYPWDDRNGDLSAALQSLNSKAGEHIAANPPAHVVRVVEALRTVVAEHQHVCLDDWEGHLSEDELARVALMRVVGGYDRDEARRRILDRRPLPLTDPTLPLTCGLGCSDNDGAEERL